MKKYINHFRIDMPLILVKALQLYKYNPQKFMDWYLSWPDLSKQPKISSIELSRKSTWLAIFLYYFWIAYGICALIIISLSPLTAFIGLAISPFLVAGAAYVIVYVFDYLSNNPKKSKQSKKPKK